jgi:hypothetical protein
MRKLIMGLSCDLKAGACIIAGLGMGYSVAISTIPMTRRMGRSTKEDSIGVVAIILVKH